MYSGIKIFVIFLVEFATKQWVVQAQEICVEGHIMDQFCIEKGTLLNAPKIKTLENPEEHAVYCLVDVPQCVKSGYHILVPNSSGKPKFRSAYKFDDSGNKKVLDFIRSVGDCGTCKPNIRKLTKGLRLTIVGGIIQDGTPPILSVNRVQLSPKTSDPSSTDDGCQPQTTATIPTSSPMLTNATTEVVTTNNQSITLTTQNTTITTINETTTTATSSTPLKTSPTTSIITDTTTNTTTNTITQRPTNTTTNNATTEVVTTNNTTTDTSTATTTDTTTTSSDKSTISTTTTNQPGDANRIGSSNIKKSKGFLIFILCTIIIFVN